LISQDKISPAKASGDRFCMKKDFPFMTISPVKKNYRDANKQSGNSNKVVFISNCHWDSP